AGGCRCPCGWPRGKQRRKVSRKSTCGHRSARCGSIRLLPSSLLARVARRQVTCRACLDRGTRVVNIRGSICALDLAAFGRLLDYQIGGGTQALVVAGSTGEAHMLEHHEFDRLLAFALEHVAGRV